MKSLLSRWSAHRKTFVHMHLLHYRLRSGHLEKSVTTNESSSLMPKHKMFLSVAPNCFYPAAKTQNTDALNLIPQQGGWPPPLSRRVLTWEDCGGLRVWGCGKCVTGSQSVLLWVQNNMHFASHVVILPLIVRLTGFHFLPLEDCNPRLSKTGLFTFNGVACKEMGPVGQCQGGRHGTSSVRCNDGAARLTS